MTASEKLTQLFENDKLTYEQQDNLNDWGVQKVSYLRSYLINWVKALRGETDSINYKENVIALYTLLNYNDDDYVVYDEDGVSELDFDTLNDALGVD